MRPVPGPPLQWVTTGFFSMGLTYTVLTSVSAIMFKNLGMDNARAAAWASMLILAYSIKPAFAPVVEMYRHKRFFVVATQVGLAACFGLVALALQAPEHIVPIVALLAIMSLLGSTQDVATDGVYITALDHRAQPRYAGVQSFSWNAAGVLAYGGLVWLSGRLHADFFDRGPASSASDWGRTWSVVFLVAGIVTAGLALWHVRRMPEGARASTSPRNLTQVLGVTADTFVTFFRKRDIWLMIGFAFFFQTSTGFLEKIGPFFMVDPRASGGLGLNNEQLGIIYGTFGLIAVLLGALTGGFVVARFGLRRTLIWMSVALNVPGVTFLLMSIFPQAGLVLVTLGVCLEKFFFGFGLVGLTMYLMQQVAPGKYMTAHFAFASSIKGLTVMLTGVVSGSLQQALGYQSYFVFVMVATIPSLVFSWLAPFHVKDDRGDPAPLEREGRAVTAGPAL